MRQIKLAYHRPPPAAPASARQAVVASLFILASVFGSAPIAAGHLQLRVVETVPRYPPYEAFCRRQPAACDLTGPGVTSHSPALVELLRTTNADVNAAIRFSLDRDQYGVEDYWTLPESGMGDCEDMALEKRARLVAAGVPRATLRLAFVYHRGYMTPHSVLTVETSDGTYVLDSYSDEVMRWDLTAYNFEARERSDGLWDRYDQSQWTYDR